MREIVVFSVVAILVAMLNFRFWPKFLFGTTLFIAGQILAFVVIGQSWPMFFEQITSSAFVLPVFLLFSFSVLMYVIRTEKVYRKDGSDEGSFYWFILALFSFFVALIMAIIIFYRFEFKVYLWLLTLLTILAYGYFLAKMNSEKRSRMLFISISLFIFAVVGTATVILT